MSKTSMSLEIGDVSALARSLRKKLKDSDAVPSHVEMLNLLVKSVGFKNYQHFKAVQEATHNVDTPDIVIELNLKRVTKAVGYFDLEGRLGRWPKKHSLRMLCLWALWSRLPARKGLSELEIDELIKLNHTFCDHALIRRLMVDHAMVARTPDGREYKRIEAAPPVEALEVIRQLN